MGTDSLQNNQDVIFPHDEIVLTFIINFLASILTVQYGVALANGHCVAVFAWTNCYNLTTLWLSLAVSGIMMPPLVVSSAVAGLITTRSLIGLISELV